MPSAASNFFPGRRRFGVLAFDTPASLTLVMSAVCFTVRLLLLLRREEAASEVE